MHVSGMFHAIMLNVLRFAIWSSRAQGNLHLLLEERLGERSVGCNKRDDCGSCCCCRKLGLL